MKIRVFASKKAQLFFYVYHLSRWHYSAYEEVASQFESVIGGLSNQQYASLHVIRRILRRHAFSDKDPAQVYFSVSRLKIRAQLCKVMGESDGKAFDAAMTTLAPALDVLWGNDATRVNKLCKEFETLSHTNQTLDLLNTISKLFGPLPRKIDICVLAYPVGFNHVGGSANVPGVLTVELADARRASEAFLVALHELTHQSIRALPISFFVRKPYSACAKKDIPWLAEMTKAEALEEVFLRFFLPDGYLAAKIQPGIRLDSTLEHFPQSVHQHIKQLVREGRCVQQKDVTLIRNYLQKNREANNASLLKTAM
jgi:hypothetical protein